MGRHPGAQLGPFPSPQGRTGDSVPACGGNDPAHPGNGAEPERFRPSERAASKPWDLPPPLAPAAPPTRESAHLRPVPWRESLDYRTPHDPSDPPPREHLLAAVSPTSLQRNPGIAT